MNDWVGQVWWVKCYYHAECQLLWVLVMAEEKKAVFPFPNRTRVRSQIHKPPTGVNSRHNNNSYAQCPLIMLTLHKPVSLKLTELLTLHGAVSAEPRDHRTTASNQTWLIQQKTIPVHDRNFIFQVTDVLVSKFLCRESILSNGYRLCGC